MLYFARKGKPICREGISYDVSGLTVLSIEVPRMKSGILAFYFDLLGSL